MMVRHKDRSLRFTLILFSFLLLLILLTLSTFPLLIASLHPSLLHLSSTPISVLSISAARSEDYALGIEQTSRMAVDNQIRIPVFNTSLLRLDMREANLNMSRHASGITPEQQLQSSQEPSTTPSRDLQEAARASLEESGDRRMPRSLSIPRYASYYAQFHRSLQTWVENKRYEPQIMSLLPRLVKDPLDRHYLGEGTVHVELTRPYKTCAVVGNSGILLTQNHSAFIDSHDMVIRLNNARIAGYEGYVGFKTTLAFINSNILHGCSRRNQCICHPYGEGVPIVLYICQLVHFMDVEVCASAHRSPIIVTDPRFDVLCTRIVKHYSIQNFVESTGKRPQDWTEAHDALMFHYSSGMQAVVLALGICERVRIFGFGKSPGAKHHYHTNQKGELDLHDYTAEYRFYHDLVHNRSSLIPFLSEAGFVLPSVELYL